MRITKKVGTKADESPLKLKMHIFGDVSELYLVIFCSPKDDMTLRLLPKEGVSNLSYFLRRSQEKQARSSVFLENLMVVISMYQFRFGKMMMHQNRECSLRVVPPFFSW